MLVASASRPRRRWALGVLRFGCGSRRLDDAACDGLVGLSPRPTRSNAADHCALGLASRRPADPLFSDEHDLLEF